MAYRFRAGDRTVQCAVRRIAREQVDDALAAIGGQHRDMATHEVRKACKKLRALVRLVRPVFADYAVENAEFRDIARLLSGVRDAKVMLDTLDLLLADASKNGELATFEPVREDFVRNLGHPARADVAHDPLQEAQARLEAARERIGAWALAEEGWDALEPGLCRIVRRARKAARTVAVDPTPLHYHELRKLMKYHWYHTRLLLPVWPSMTEPRAAELARLADLLGLHHDISVFEARLGGSLPHGDRRRAVVALLSRAEDRRAALEREAGPLVARLLAQKPNALAKHWRKLWQIWRDERRGL